jgi:exonuclease SbcC
MLITRVELENIKNYESGEFEFEPGVTAISGPNGAGKTTILEAIAYALFDHLPYKKEDFLRRGSKKGSVRVTFKSVVDDREYTVYRDTAAGYHIYDPITKLRLVEQKSQVGAWLKLHLGVEPGTDLKTLFVSTIGVPQGTFTVDFAEQPAKRKVGFDKVLRVEEYQRSSDDLRALVRLLESREAEVREEIARTEVEVEALDGLMVEREKYLDAIERLRRDLAAAEGARARARAELERLDAAERGIERLSGEVAVLGSRVEEIARRRSVIGDEVERARAASRAVAATLAGFTVYNEASARLAELESRVAERDRIKKDLSERERQMFQAEAALSTLREKLAQIASDREELERLRPLAAEQEALESRGKQLQTAIGELTMLERRAREADEELKSLRQEFARISKQIDEAASLKQAAESVPRLEQERRSTEAELSEMRVAFERLNERKRDLRRLREAVARINGEVATLEREMAAGLDAEKVVAMLPEMEAESEAATEEMASLKAALEREQKILSQIKGGLCPLLAEPCRNMKPGQTLDQFFKIQAGTERARLTELERKRKQLQQKLADARLALKASSALATQRTQHARHLEDLEIARKDLVAAEKEIAGAAVSEAGIRQMAARLEAAGEELQRALAARSKYESLDLLRERHERLKVEGTEKRRALEAMKAEVETLGGLGDELARLEARLAELDDPRGRSRLLGQGLLKEAELRHSLTALEGEELRLKDSVGELLQQLDGFAGLDEEAATERARRAACETDYRTYIESQPVAALLESREQELKTVEAELADVRARWGALGRELDGLRAAYDAGAHQSARAELEQLLNRVATLGSELSGLEGRVVELGERIELLVAARQRMAELLERKERCGDLLSLTEFIRDLLKKAGPFITEAHLQSISMEANQLYREITGNPMVSLRWDMGYEIVLEEEGHERAFASLSGGEQMAAALAVRLALLKELSDMRIAFFDEPTTNMDEERRRNLAQQIGRIKDFNQLFVISHDDAFEGFTDRVVTVKAPVDRA